MKKSFTLSLLLLSVYSFAQDSSFQLKDYKYRTPGYKALAVGFNLAGDYKSANENNEAGREHHLDLGPVSLSYTKLASTETRISQSRLSLQSASRFSGSSYKGKDAHATRSNSSFSWYRSDQFYRAKGWYFELGHQLSTDYTAQNTNDTIYKHRYKILFAQGNLILGMGKGRIENVQDAQMALYLLEDLSAQHLLNRAPTAEETRLLAQLITDINNKRVFDSRRRRIYELTRLDSFFRSSGLAPQTDIRHFTTINDNWAIVLYPSRFSGTNWYLRLLPGIGYQHFAFDYFLPTPASSSKTENTVLNLSPVIGFTKYRPLSLRWQQDFGGSLAYNFGRSKLNTEATDLGGTNKTSNTTTHSNSTANLFYSIGYYPNNRTQIIGRLDVTGNFYQEGVFELLTQFGFGAQYFISYRTYLSASAYARYNQRDGKLNAGNFDSRNFSAGFSVSLSHIIF